jgi:two-component system chemotaxis sensor kinase CheA
MSDFHSNEQFLDMYIFETAQNIEQIEEAILSSEESSGYSNEVINDIFRHMHTIKGSSAVMHFEHISTLAHAIEDLFFFIRDEQPQNLDTSSINDLILAGVDFIKIELEKIKNENEADGDASILISNIRNLLEVLKGNFVSVPQEKAVLIEQPLTLEPIESDFQSLSKNIFKATIFFKEGCEMENVRAFVIINHLKEFSNEIFHIPKDIIEDVESVRFIREKGLVIYVKTEQSYEEMYEFFMQTLFLKELQLVELEDDQEMKKYFADEIKPVQNDNAIKTNKAVLQEEKEVHSSHVQSIISVNVAKLDKLMDLVGEMVIAEAMVIQNPDLEGLEIDNFHKAARHLHKITTEIQDMVMSIRMVPLANTFHKMYRIVRDMGKKLGKDVKLQIFGEETEVDKNIIEHISDPLMHIVRNSIDHGIENGEEREGKGKPRTGTVTIEAKNSGSDVLIIISDDGKGLNKGKLLARAKDHDLLTKPESELSDKEIYNLIFIPGFSTKENITEFSGRGVGMDVVTRNLEAVGGSASVDSLVEAGTTITLKIPLTLAIIDGMNVRVGDSSYTIPITTIKESFRPEKKDIFTDPDGNEMIMVRGDCYPILRLHECYGVLTKVTDFSDGIFIMVEQDNRILCIFADELVGQQQVVVKALPDYIKNKRKIQGLAGCTLLGDGSISLILDIGGIVSLKEQQAAVTG